VKAAFPRGLIDLVVYYADDADRRMSEAMAGLDLKPMKVRERVTLACASGWKRSRHQRSLAPRGRRSSRCRSIRSTRCNRLSPVDAIWRAVGDTSADFNFYTKRALLAGVYTATMLHWFADPSEGAKDTWTFPRQAHRERDANREIQSDRGEVSRGVAEPADDPRQFRHPRS